VARSHCTKTARAAHAGTTARDAAEMGERTYFLDNAAMCLILIGCPDSYHFNY